MLALLGVLDFLALMYLLHWSILTPDALNILDVEVSLAQSGRMLWRPWKICSVSWNPVQLPENWRGVSSALVYIFVSRQKWNHQWEQIITNQLCYIVFTELGGKEGFCWGPFCNRCLSVVAPVSFHFFPIHIFSQEVIFSTSWKCWCTYSAELLSKCTPVQEGCCIWLVFSKQLL